ncbi:unnamed protein product, partial [Rotaria sp. Silwood1]
KRLRPSKLIISNSNMPTEIEFVLNELDLLSKVNFNYVHHFSLVECTQNDFEEIDSFVKMYNSLQSVTITKSKSNKNEDSMEKFNNWHAS